MQRIIPSTATRTPSLLLFPRFSFRTVAMAQSPAAAQSLKQHLQEKKVRDLILAKRSLVDVPHTATLSEAMTTLVSHHVLAVPVSAPPDHWIGAGGSMIMESDEQTGAVRKQYIGVLTMLDSLAHIAGDGGERLELDQKMADPVTAVIGHCLEGLSLWTLNPNTGILDCLEVFSKGIHRALVPLDSHVDSTSGVELAELAPGYRMLSQMDVVRFLKENAKEMSGIVSRSAKDLGAISRTVYAITDRTKVVDAIKCMRGHLINAVPIVASEDDDPEENHSCLLDVTGEGRRLVGTFSATDLRGCHLATLQSWLFVSALDFTEKTSSSPLYAGTSEGTRPRRPVTCKNESSLTEVMEKAVDKHVHRVWVVDDQGLLTGIVSLTDIIRVLRVAILSA
ncbi:SNF1-related protein kinase regulatory subunit gamma-like PV42a [Punica granatum]|uniref:SNF1-related protein kinase regulatory subunit gamma-like PV42a n=2 Tax=Punica granatum TaxID=22663 RepID=A0A6P8D4C9_PUNGR|nr:SNF1-related protein kinase regulatory subunit gamma-like PV42a [Punica granatum]PKI31991.1 hypothetical protein CRG98_047600 [Punica granatum]